MVHAAQALALRATGLPRTDHGTSEINYLVVRPERVEGRAANCDTVSWWERDASTHRSVFNLGKIFADA